MKKIGIFGGTFDPFHLGHLTISKCFIEKCNLDKCFIVPAKCSPFKTNKNNLYNDTERIEIIQNEISVIDKLELSFYEICNENAISYSIDTINYFKELYSDAELYLLIGYDVALSFTKWKDYKKILEIAKIVIANRPDVDTIKSNLEITDYILLENPIIDITSTQIREKVSCNREV